MPLKHEKMLKAVAHQLKYELKLLTKFQIAQPFKVFTTNIWGSFGEGSGGIR
jgi:hypothetical protein